jgi:trehalose 6-phosphate synthase
MRFVESAEDCLESVRSKHNLSADIKIGLGVDRLDYSKGILERFRSVERFLELNPQWVGKFTFIQIAAPSRSTIAAYQSFEAEVHELARAINGRFTTAAVPPLILLAEHHEPKSVYTYMRATNLMYVSSLHDGMNLVSKEFVAAREDEQGVLLLSMFAGASRELTESLIVNPYDVDQSAAAILAALTMPAQEQRERLHAMRAHVREFNIFRWAGKMLLDAALVRRRSVFEKRFASFS